MFFEVKEYSKCSNEQQFKMACIRNMKKQNLINKIDNVSLFCIETEETVLGFPDVMQLTCTKDKNVCEFYEFKFSNDKGWIHFQPAQPAFYRMNPGMKITVVAYNKQTKNVHVFDAHETSNISSYYCPELGRVNLTTAEKVYNESTDCKS